MLRLACAKARAAGHFACLIRALPGNAIAVCFSPRVGVDTRRISMEHGLCDKAYNYVGYRNARNIFDPPPVPKANEGASCISVRDRRRNLFRPTIGKYGMRNESCSATGGASLGLG